MEAWATYVVHVVLSVCANAVCSVQCLYAHELYEFVASTQILQHVKLYSICTILDLLYVCTHVQYGFLMTDVQYS